MGCQRAEQRDRQRLGRRLAVPQRGVLDVEPAVVERGHRLAQQVVEAAEVDEEVRAGVDRPGDRRRYDVVVPVEPRGVPVAVRGRPLSSEAMRRLEPPRPGDGDLAGGDEREEGGDRLGHP